MDDQLHWQPGSDEWHGDHESDPDEELDGLEFYDDHWIRD
jgi:hypothetical protein